MFDTPEAHFAITAAREAAYIARQVQRELVSSALTKQDRSPVTVADFASQAVVAKRLIDRFPEMVLVGEESASELREEHNAETAEQILHYVRHAFPAATTDDVCAWIDSGVGEPPEAYWTLDPVDGTKGFLRGDQYAVALAWVVDGKVQLGVLACPELEAAHIVRRGGKGSLVAAQRGEPTQVQDLAGRDAWAPLQVDPRSDVAQARLLRSVEKAHTDTGGIGELVQALGIEADPTPMDSQAKYAVLAAGGGDVNLRLLSPERPDYREKVWDQAAGSIVVEQAGGRVTDLDGAPLDFSRGRTLANNRGILATNGRLHEALLEGLKRIGA